MNNNRRYFVSTHDIKFLSKIYEDMKSSGIDEATDVKFKNLISKLSKIKEMRDLEIL